MRTNQFTDNYRPIDALIGSLLALVSVGADGKPCIDDAGAKLLIQEFIDRALMGKA